jgi:flavin reductase (DIM6/NTAB) family NADH-FMN oxidoreductase RutF
MERITIDPNDLKVDIIRIWGSQYFLLTAGENQAGRFNTMTVAWGSLGVMWNQPFAQAVVRPSRHTHRFMDTYDTFTLCAFPPEYQDALMLCGTKSGRDTDKVKETGLTPIDSSQVAAPGFDEAELILECRKLYRDEFKPQLFLDSRIEPNYNGSDYHTVYFGEIVGISGVEKYRA